MKTVLLTNTIIILLLTNSFAQDILFDSTSIEPFEGLKNCSFAVGKINKDKYQDIFVTGENKDGKWVAKLYFNNPENPGSFIEDKENKFSCSGKTSVFMKDMNNDGQLDIVVGGKTFFNKKYGKKIASKDGNTEVGISNFTLGDVDNDGDIDMITYRIYETLKYPIEFQFFINDGKGDLSEGKIELPKYVGIKKMVIADVNADKKNDIVLLATKDNSIFDKGDSIQICIGTGNGTFIEQENGAFYGMKNATFKLVGNSWEGAQDILTTGEIDGKRKTILYKNNGKGNFSTLAYFQSGGVANGTIGIGDFDDNLGDDFLLVGQYETTLYLYSKNQSYTYMKQTNIPFERVVRHGTLVVEDFNGDYFNDVLISGEDINGNCFSKLYISKMN